MQLTRIVTAVFGAAPTRATQPITIARDPAIERPPQKHAARKVEQRHRPPETAQPERKITDRCGAPTPIAVSVDEAHLLHQPIGRQVGPALGDFGSVQRQVRQLSLAIPPRQLSDLGGADAAVAVVDDDIGVGSLVGIGQGC